MVFTFNEFRVLMEKQSEPITVLESCISNLEFTIQIYIYIYIYIYTHTHTHTKRERGIVNLY